MPSKKQLEKTSKFLSFVLRHKPEAIGIVLDANGWVPLSELIEKASSEIALTTDLIEQVVKTSEKQRFALSTDGDRIRANQGHSVQVDLELVPKIPPAILFHGTATRFLDSIQEEGLRPGQRHHVHLSADRETAIAVGQRHGKVVVLEIASGEMQAKGHRFFQSENGVWLTNRVPAKFMRRLGEE
ncbi:RNA 2'-phosphotransferase [Pelagibius sp. Alg239-R121]|uniref:RNA 2'-phosphotransferase n=1 Tax=Pelagibius sp. Alg239-R121 TaxID=2993448 RepID=UPI0024A79B42|nr:RNA 2'-phosphotransferase [Pelagibius sp. Alg239-R121]